MSFRYLRWVIVGIAVALQIAAIFGFLYWRTRLASRWPWGEEVATEPKAEPIIGPIEEPAV